jgi:hypothetical protein
MNISSSLISVPLATIAIVVINSIWFGPKTFYPIWWKSMGKEMKKPEDRDTSGKTMLRLFGGSFAAALAQAIVLFVAIFASGFSVAGGAIMGLGFGVVAAGASLAHRLFGEQGFKVWIIEVAADIIALMAAGAIIAAFVAH